MLNDINFLQSKGEIQNAKSVLSEMKSKFPDSTPVSYTHLRAHETVLDLVCRLLLEKKKKKKLQ